MEFLTENVNEYIPFEETTTSWKSGSRIKETKTKSWEGDGIA